MTSDPLAVTGVPAHSAEGWPIAAAMLPFPSVTSSGAPVAEASAEYWAQVLSRVAHEGFTEVDLTDSWLAVADLVPDRLDELRSVLDSLGLTAWALSAIRRSVIDPESGEANLAYSHRAIEAAASLGCSVVSVGLHRPLSPRQKDALWFWTVPGPQDADDRETWNLTVRRLRELSEHARSVGLGLSLEMYEDTLLGTADSAVRLVEDIGHEAVGLNPDLGNLYRMQRAIEPFLESVAKCLPHSNYWHVKSYYRMEDPVAGVVLSVPAPMRSGSMDYRGALAIALDSGYDAAFCVEHYGGDGLSVMAANRDYLRTLLASPGHDLRRHPLV